MHAERRHCFHIRIGAGFLYCGFTLRSGCHRFKMPAVKSKLRVLDDEFFELLCRGARFLRFLFRHAFKLLVGQHPRLHAGTQRHVAEWHCLCAALLYVSAAVERHADGLRFAVAIHENVANDRRMRQFCTPYELHAHLRAGHDLGAHFFGE